jgi:hypothetical protein
MRGFNQYFAHVYFAIKAIHGWWSVIIIVFTFDDLALFLSPESGGGFVTFLGNIPSTPHLYTVNTSHLVLSRQAKNPCPARL